MTHVTVGEGDKYSRVCGYVLKEMKGPESDVKEGPLKRVGKINACGRLTPKNHVSELCRL